MISVIIVEDEFLVRLGLKSAVDWEKRGFQIVGEATNGEEGLELFLKHRPKLVVTDIKMPKKDGITLMEEIRQHDASVFFIILTAYKDFEYAQTAIRLGVENYVVKGTVFNDELGYSLDRIREKVGLTDQLSTATSPKKDWTYYTDNNVHIQDITEFSADKDVYAVASKLKGIRDESLLASYLSLIENTLSQNKIPFFSISHKEYCYIIIKTSTIENACTAMINSAKRYLNKDAICGISFEAAVDNKISVLMDQAKTACNRNIVNHSQIYIYSVREDDRSIVADQLISAFNMSLLSSNHKSCTESLNEIKAYIIKHGKGSILQRIAYQIVLILAKYEPSIVYKDFSLSLLESDDIDTIFSEISESSISICNNITSRLTQAALHIEKAITYIQLNVSKNIKLKDVSEHIHISSNYLGRLFYEETGSYMTNYIMEQKIARACILLKESDFSMADIAQEVGISDQQYFSKTFKKIIGISPTQYVKKI